MSSFSRRIPILGSLLRKMDAMEEKIKENKLEICDLWKRNNRLARDVRELMSAHFSTLPLPLLIRDLKRWYRDMTGQDLHLDNPQTMNEKMQWLKLYDRDPVKTVMADKYLVREWAGKIIGAEHFIPLLGVWDSSNQIDFAKLPKQFVLKANHGSGWNIIVKDKDKLNWEETKMTLDEWMATDFTFENGFELHYHDIPRKIIAEQYMETETGDLPDYKFMCFDGKVEFMYLDFDRFTCHRRNLYDRNFNFMPVLRGYPNDPSRKFQKPACYDEMVEMAEKLAKYQPLLRVDFYYVNGKVYLGELTVTPGSGTMSFDPPEWDLIYGRKITLPKRKNP